jgi:predicted  nucleic acid-binding Zn-ribbon protein
LEIIKPKLIRLEEKRKLEKLRNNLEKERSWLNKSKLIQEIQEINQNIEIHKKQITDLESNLIDQDNLIKNIEKAIEDRKSEIQACSEELGVVNLRKGLYRKINEWQQGKGRLC